MPRSLTLIQLVFLISTMSSVRLAVRWWYGGSRTSASSGTSPAKDNVLVVGLNHVTELYLRCVADLASDKISIVGILDETPELKGRLLHHHKVLGQPVELPQVLAKFNVHGVEIKHVVVTVRFDTLSEKSRETLLRWERSGHIELDMFEERLGFGEASGGSGVTGGDAVLPNRNETCVANNNEFLKKKSAYAYVKRAIDFIGASVFLLVLSPLILFVSLLVAFDVGFPLIFWQQRPGYQGIPFRLYKFRTMNTGYDKSGNRIDDKHRTSRIGRFLRRYRLDEFPQLFNILTGEMSFVGPRPLLPVDQPKGFNPRFAVVPGLSGWAQVNGGKLVSVEDKTILDVWYVNNFSFWLDLKIVFRTIKVLVLGEQLNEDAIRIAYDEQGAGGHSEQAPVSLASKDENNNDAYHEHKNVV
jgi:lipopolysaccharide/colanic/teichoic acid biosynthesis glycosyltransferase